MYKVYGAIITKGALPSRYHSPNGQIDPNKGQLTLDEKRIPLADASDDDVLLELQQIYRTTIQKYSNERVDFVNPVLRHFRDLNKIRKDILFQL